MGKKWPRASRGRAAAIAAFATLSVRSDFGR
jgi:hypothetical protein